MDYTADYQLDRLLKMGAGSDTEFANNVCKILLNGLPVKVKPEGACSTFVAATPDGHKGTTSICSFPKRSALSRW